MRFDWGLTNVSWPNYDDVYVLANTPGVPLEWIYAACRIPKFRRARVRAHIGVIDFVELGRLNAASIENGDGYRLLTAVCPEYSGPVPLCSQLELRADPRSDQKIADEFGVHRQKLRRWRTNNIFDPLTGERMIPNRGRSIAELKFARF